MRTTRLWSATTTRTAGTRESVTSRSTTSTAESIRSPTSSRAPKLTRTPSPRSSTRCPRVCRPPTSRWPSRDTGWTERSVPQPPHHGVAVAVERQRPAVDGLVVCHDGPLSGHTPCLLQGDVHVRVEPRGVGAVPGGGAGHQAAARLPLLQLQAGLALLHGLGSGEERRLEEVLLDVLLRGDQLRAGRLGHRQQRFALPLLQRQERFALLHRQPRRAGQRQTQYSSTTPTNDPYLHLAHPRARHPAGLPLLQRQERDVTSTRPAPPSGTRSDCKHGYTYRTKGSPTTSRRRGRSPAGTFASQPQSNARPSQ